MASRPHHGAMAWRTAVGARARALAGWNRRHVVAVLAGALVLVGLTAVARDEGFPTAAVDVGGGTVWVASPTVGQLALLSGPSGALAVRVKVADARQDLLAVQAGETGYALNRTTGTVVRVDPVSWQKIEKRPLEGAGEGLGLTAGRDAVFAVDGRGGTVVEADPATLEPRGRPIGLVGSVTEGASVVDDDGALWLLDETTGDLVRYTDGEPRSWDGVARPGTGRLVLVDGAAAVVDRVTDTVRVLRRGGPSRPVCLGVDTDDDTVQVGGSGTSAVVLAASGRRGVLRIADVEDGRCVDVVPGVGAPGQRLGAPVEVFGRAFVPNYSTGEVVVVDLGTGAIVARPEVLDPETQFELAGRDGFAFYNDPASEHAGVIDLDGEVRRVAKYSTDAPDEGLFEPGRDVPPAVTPEGQEAVAPPLSAPPPTATPSPTPGAPEKEQDDDQPGPRADRVPRGPVTDGNPRTAPQSPTESPPPVPVVVTVVVRGPGVVTLASPALPGATTCGPDATCPVTVPTGAPVQLVASQDAGEPELLAWEGCDEQSSGADGSTCAVVAGTRTVAATFASPPAPRAATLAAQFTTSDVLLQDVAHLLVTVDFDASALPGRVVATVPPGLRPLLPLPAGCAQNTTVVCDVEVPHADLDLPFTAVAAGQATVQVDLRLGPDNELSTTKPAAITVVAPPTLSRVDLRVVPAVVSPGASVTVTVDVQMNVAMSYTMELSLPNALAIDQPFDRCSWEGDDVQGVITCQRDGIVGSTSVPLQFKAAYEVYAPLRATVRAADGSVLSSNEEWIDVGP